MRPAFAFLALRGASGPAVSPLYVRLSSLTFRSFWLGTHVRMFALTHLPVRPENLTYFRSHVTPANPLRMRG